MSAGIAAGQLRSLERSFDNAHVERQPIEHKPDRFNGELEGAHTVHGDPILCRVTIEWSDGTHSEHNALTKQWTRTHVRVLFRRMAENIGINDASIPDLPELWVRADQCSRR